MFSENPNGFNYVARMMNNGDTPNEMSFCDAKEFVQSVAWI